MSSSLVDVAAYWAMEASPTVDEVGALDLAFNRGVTINAGKNNNGAFHNSAQFRRATIAASGVLQGPDIAFSFSCWRLFDPALLAAPASPATPTIASLGLHTGDVTDYGWALWLEYHDGNYASLRAQTRSTGGTEDMIEATGLSFGDAGWHHYVLTRAAGASSAIKIYYDGALVASGTSVGSKATTNSFLVGSFAPGVTNCLTGLTQIRGNFDEVGYWTRELTSGEVTELYNGGTGFFYPFLTAPDAPVLRYGPGIEKVVFNWAEPDDGGSAITKYTLYLDGVLHTDDITSPHEVTGLTPEGINTGPWTLTATNAIGESDPSNELLAAPASTLPRLRELRVGPRDD